MTKAQSVTVKDPKAVALSVWKALSESRWGDIHPFLAENVVWQMMGCEFIANKGVFIGRDQVINDLFSIGATVYLPDTFKVKINHLHSSGEFVILEYVVNCINNRGREYKDATYCAVLKIEDGLIVEAREYADSYKIKSVHFDD